MKLPSPDKMRLRQRRNFWGLIGFGIGIAYWLVESAIDSFFFDEIGLFEAVFAPSIDVLLMRLSTLATVTAFGVYVQWSLARLHKAHEEIQHLALHDSLTGLPNRLLFYDRLAQALAQAKRRSGKLGLLMLDLDSFKEVNDSLGHHVGDLLLRSIGERISGISRSSDTVARWGGDEFVVMLLDITTVEGAVRASDKIRAGLEEPFVIDGHVLRVVCSIGVATYPDDAEAANSLLRAADAAMYRAKRKPGAYPLAE